jgi:hypothetical protein
MTATKKLQTMFLRSRICSLRLTLALLASIASIASAQTLPRWETERQVVVDGVAHELNSDIRWAIVNSAGTVFVSQVNARKIHVFDSVGKRITVFGRRGSGPGDFDGMWNAGLIGDSVWVYDINLRRVSVITPEAKLGRSLKIDQVKVPRTLQLPVPRIAGFSLLSLLPDGGQVTLAVPQGGTMSAANKMLPGTMILRANSRAEAEELIGWKPEILETAQPEKGPFWVEQPFANAPQFAHSVDGSWLATAVATLADSIGTASVTAFRANGDTAFTRTLILSLRPIADSIANRAYAARELEISRGNDARERLAAFRGIPRVRYHPPLRSLMVSTDGRVLLGFNTEDSEREYMLIGSDGRPLATLRLPKGDMPMQFDGGVIWARAHDSDGVPAIVRHRIVPP